MIRRPPRSTHCISSAASDVYKRQVATSGITALKNIQYFDAGDAILDTIVGIVAGMSFQMADRTRPILAFASTPSGDLKVSARGTQDLVRSGLDLADALSHSAHAVGGVGGGHNVAAGATIPPAAKQEFLELMDSAVGKQLCRQLITNRSDIIAEQQSQKPLQLKLIPKTAIQ
eukprot:TRINITY_DN11749_c0_g1_i1.p3 TRINITY_DN11749_c0_g1~~TRINITY_DN11749_c0_g1_i1.p3  ORF type:complete len:173 (-),score=32.58 TRINITY_DN11749_c0_g1_i1:176-694(-)